MIDSMISLRRLIQDMSPEALEQIIDAIRSRPDVAAVDVVTMNDVKDMDEKYKREFCRQSTEEH